MILLQAVAKAASPAGACLRLVELGLIDLFSSDETLAELEDVLNRPMLRRKLRTITDERVVRLMALLRHKAHIIKDIPRAFAYPRDPKDEPYINLAVAAKASFLISRDRDLLDLADAVSPEAVRLRSLAPEIRIVAPEIFLEHFRRRTS